MKTLLRHRLTRRYYRGNGRWSIQRHLGQDFSDIRSALLACIEHGLSDMELVLLPEPPEAEIAVPICPSAQVPGTLG